MTEKDNFLTQLRNNRGHVFTACEKAGVSFSHYERWMAGDIAFRREVDVINKEVVEWVDEQLITEIEYGQDRIQAIRLFYQRFGLLEKTDESVEQHSEEEIKSRIVDMQKRLRDSLAPVEMISNGSGG